MAKQKSATREELETAARDFLESLAGMDDRRAVIMAMGFLDDALAAALTAFFVVDTAKRCPQFLTSYAHRCKAAYAVGLVGPWILRDLERLGEIRNMFAHRWQTQRFSLSQVQARCRALETGTFLADGKDLGPRDLCLQTVAFLAQVLIGMARRQEHRAKGPDPKVVTSDAPAAGVVGR